MPDNIITELQTVACAGGFAGVGGMLHYLLKVHSDSKKESALVAHQAMPNFENAVALSLTTDNDDTMVNVMWRFFPAKL